MIGTFADAATEDTWNGLDTKAARTIPKAIWPVVRRKLDLLNRVTRLDALRVPPGNQFKALKGSNAGVYQLRVNDQDPDQVYISRSTSMASAAKTSTTTSVRRLLPTHRPPTHPGEMLLEEFLKPAGITQVEAAARIGVPFQRMNTLVKGRRGVTADTALRLAKLTGMDAGFWMGLQADFDLWHALRDVDLSKITPLKKSA